MKVEFFVSALKKVEICLECETNNLPSIGDHILYDGIEWIVRCRVFDYDKNRIKIFIRKATDNDISYM